MISKISIAKKVKNFFTILFFYLFFFLIGDLIFSNLIYRNQLDIKYNCYDYKNFNYENEIFHDYFLESNCEATESQKTASPYKVFTDQDGYRFSGKKRSTKDKNLIFIGDSTTYGKGSKFENSFVGIIETKKDNYGIYNLAVPGYGIQKYYYVLNKYFERNTASKIFITIDMTEILDAADRWINIPNSLSPVLESAHINKEISNWKKIQNSNFKGTKLLIFHLRNSIRTAKIKIKSFNLNSENLKNSTGSSDWANFTYIDKKDLNISERDFENSISNIKKYFEKINTLAKENNAETYLIIFPWPENLIYGQEKFNWENFNKELCESNNCSEILNFFEDFRKVMNENDDWQNLIYIKDDIHFTKYGNNLIASKILNFIKD